MLDFSQLTDDQLIELVRSACEYALSKDPAIAAAMRETMLSEAERARVARTAGELEIAAQRAAQRMRISADAARQKRAEEKLRQAEEVAARAAETERQQKQIDRGWLVTIGKIVNRDPASISILHYRHDDGTRVVVLPGHDRFDPSHLAACDPRMHRVHAIRQLVRVKPALAEMLTRFAELYPSGTFISGRDFDWTTP